MSNRRKPSGLREALAAKRRHTVPHDLRIVDDATADAADAELDESRMAAATARHFLDRAKARGSEGVEAATATCGEADQRLEAAETARAECYWRLNVSSIAPAVFEAIKAAHPAGPDAQAKGMRYDDIAMRPALLSACVTDETGEQLTADEWAAELASGRWSEGEIVELAMKAHVVNNTAPRYANPKASDGTPSWPPAWLTAGPAGSR